ncbi:MAG: redoxin domain-containing protein [Dysgonomonas sp.]
MRKIFYLIGLCLLIVACKQTSDKLVLTATDITTTNDIYVYDIINNKIIDTIKVTNGGFTYTHDVADEPQLLALSDNIAMKSYLITEKGNLTMSGNDGVVKGAPLNDRLASLDAAFRNATKEIEEEAQTMFKNAEKDSRNLTDTEMAELKVMEKERVALITEVVKEFYEKDKETIIGFFELMLIQNDLPFEDFKSMYEQGGETTKNFPPFVKMLETKANMEKTKIGAKFIDFEGVNPKDTTQTIKLSDFAGKGKYVLLDFWASWCPPCREAMPEIKALNDKYSAKGLEVIGVVVNDQLENHLQSAASLNVTWTQIFDDKDALVALYRIEGIPTLILLDKDGTILLRSHDKQEIKEKVESLLGK